MKKNQSKKGFTLLEVLFALAIFSIGLLAIIGMTTMTIKSNYMSKNLTTAVHLAQNKLDALKARSYDDIAGSIATEFGLDSQENEGSGIFDRSVTLLSTSVDPNYKTVEVIVSWSDPDLRRVAMQTIIAQ